jgi:hypothetical protein
MRYEVFLECFEAKETFIYILFPTKYSNVYYLHFTMFYFIYNV